MNCFRDDGRCLEVIRSDQAAGGTIFSPKVVPNRLMAER